MIRSTSLDPGLVDRNERDPAGFEPAADVRLRHREAGAEQSDARDAVGDELVAGRIGDVEHRDADIRGGCVEHLVAGVRRDDHAFGTCGLKALGRFDRHMGDAVPVAGQLHFREGREVEALDHQLGAVQPAEPLGDAAIDMLVVKRGRRPARPANDPQLAQNACPFPTLALS